MNRTLTALHSTHTMLYPMSDISFNFEELVSLPTLFSLLSSQLRIQKQFYRFHPEEDQNIHPKSTFDLDMDGTRIRDRGSRWLTWITDCKFYWGKTKYFEVVVEAISMNRFIMLGICEKDIYPAATCISENRLYIGEHHYEVKAGDKLGLLFDGAKNAAFYCLNGKILKQIFNYRPELWEDKNVPRYAVACMACGNNIIRINNDALMPI